MKTTAKIGILVGALCIGGILLKVVWAVVSTVLFTVLGFAIKMAVLAALAYGAYLLVKKVFLDTK